LPDISKTLPFPSTFVLNENIIKNIGGKIMSKSTYVHTRVDPMLKEHAEMIFSKLGLSLTDAVTLFLRQVTLRDGLPFEVAVPSSDNIYRQEKQALLDRQLQALEKDIALGLEASERGEVLSAEQARARTKNRLEQLRK
jgi:addiction module RelB/DinJ family antitoxin